MPAKEAAPRTKALLSLHSVSKAFGGTRALDGVDFEVAKREVHALVGQNGAGKSTIIKILSGYLAPDTGELTMQGQQVPLPLPPRRARQLGLAFLHQNLSLHPELSVLENMRVGRYRTTRYGRVRWAAERVEVRRLLKSVGVAVHPDTPVRRLPQAERALLAFARAVQDIDPSHGGLLVLDEPTACLPGPTVKRLFEAIRSLVDEGASVLFVSHKLDEVLAISDRISVLRDGRMVGTVTRAAASNRELIRLMLGREPSSMYPDLNVSPGESILSASGLAGSVAQEVSFDVRAGEILGLTGLVGMGHDEVPYLIFGAKKAVAGSVTIGQEGVRAAQMLPARARGLGIALLPADRQGQGAILAATVLENLTMPILKRFVKRGLFQSRQERAHAITMLTSFSVRPNDPDRTLAKLSGGNQQKVLFAKWVQTDPRLLLLHEPTQGIDVSARQEVFSAISQVASSGVAVVIASSEHEDLARICNRVLVFRDGQIRQELVGRNLTVERIIDECYTADPVSLRAS